MQEWNGLGTVVEEEVSTDRIRVDWGVSMLLFAVLIQGQEVTG
jgi:hypothetical protein